MLLKSRCVPCALAFLIAALLVYPRHAMGQDLPRRVETADGSFIKSWLLLAPIPAKSSSSQDLAQALEEDYLLPLGGEGSARPNAEQTLEVGEQSLVWKSVTSSDDIVDLVKACGLHEHAVAYAYAEVDSPRGGRAVLGIGSDDAIKMWLNGELVHEHSAGRPVAKDEDLLQVNLRAGANSVLLKVQNFSGDWGFVWRVLDDAALQERLVSAARTGDRPAIDRLLGWNTNVNGADSLGLTALHTARISGDRELAEYLISRGADPEIAPPSWVTLGEKLLRDATGDNSAGVAVLVARDGEILWRAGYGFASLAHRVPVTPQTKFRIGSVTKQFTAAAILKLQEDGKLRIDDTLDKFFPDYPRGDEITIRHLLTHTSGIRSYTDKPDFLSQATTFIEPHQLIASFRDEPHDFEPGQGWHYCNSGYFLLGEIVARVSGQTYGDYLSETFFEPLEMHDSGVHHWSDVLEHEATGYSWEGDAFKKALNWNMSWAGGAGAIYATVEDLYRWNEAVFGGHVLNDETLREAFTPVVVPNQAAGSMPYGFGWIISEQRGLKTIGHGGGLHGFLSQLVRFPDQHVTVVALVNASPTPSRLMPARITSELAQFLLWEEMAPAPSRQVDPTVNPDIYDDYVGQYDYVTGVMAVTKEGERLFAQLTGQPKWEVFPESETEFFWKVVDAQVTFVRNEAGEVTHVLHRQGGQEFKAPRIKARQTVEVEPEVLDAYVGRYDYGGRIAVLTVTQEGKGLFAQMTGQPKFEIYPASDNEFFWKVVNATVKFTRDEEGTVTEAIHQQGGRTIHAPKIE